MGKLALAVCLSFTLAGCGLTGPDMTDPDTGEVVKSPISVAGGELLDRGADLAPGLILDATDEDGLSEGGQLAIGGAVLASLLAGIGAYRRRKTILAKRKARGE